MSREENANPAAPRGDARPEASAIDRALLTAAMGAADSATGHVAELQRQTRVYDTILSGTDDFAYIFDRAGRFVYANRRLLQVWAKTLDEIVGKTCYDLGYPAWHADMHMREIAQVIETRRSIRGEVPFTGDSGIFGVYDYIFTPVIGATGEVDFVAGTTRDVTERKRLEARDKFLIALDDAVRQLVDPQDSMNTATRLLGEHLDVSRCAYADVEADENTFNLTGDHNRGVESIVGRYTFTQFGAETLRLMRAGEPFVVEDSEVDPRTQDVLASFRQTRIGAVICVPILKSGRFVAAMAVHSTQPRKWLADEVDLVRLVADRCWELIERGRVTRELQHSEFRLRMAVATGRLGVWTLDLLTMQLTCSDICKENFGRPAGTPFTYQQLSEAVHPEDRAMWSAAVNHAIAEKVELDLEYRIDWPDHTAHWIAVRGRATYLPNGRPDQMSGVSLDITSKKRVEEERLRLLESERAARSQAEHISRMKDEFLATLGHELRTPLHAILGWSQLIKAPNASPERILNGLDVIERNARAQSRIIEDLLDMSRIISGKVRLDIQPLDLGALVAAAVDTARPTADSKGVLLQTIVDPLNGISVRGDSNRLQQVLWNLLTNAIKFTPKGGTITAVLQRIDSNLQISVADTGDGIAPEFLPFVFDRFRQSDAATTRRHGGLGLGLSIVRQLVELHGGHVSAYSEGVGRGSQFFVRLPVASPLPAQAAKVRFSNVAPASNTAVADTRFFGLDGVRILIVDDEPDARHLVQRLLEEHRAVVTAVESANAALRCFERETFDVLISDIGMPVHDGFHLIQQLRSIPTGNTTPAIALTAYARAEDKHRVLASGFQRHLTKPVEPAHLVAAVCELIGKKGVV